MDRLVTDKFKELFSTEVERRNIPHIDIESFRAFALSVHEARYKQNMYPSIQEMLRLHTIVEIVDIFLHEYSVIHPEILPYTYQLRTFNTDQINSFKQQIGRSHTPCYAPFTSLDFHINGSISICCHTKTYPVGTYPEDSIHSVWFGKALSTFRDNLKNFKFPTPCTKCVHHIISGYKENSIQSLFDDDNLSSLIPDNVNEEMFKTYPYAFKKYYPTMFTFQLSDVCNYECIMCGGAFSSSIRKNREQRPAFNTLYDDNFVEQLREFIPHLKKVYFVGGEPLMSSINYKIMDLISELNPNLQVYITTNGSVINNRIKQLIDKLPNLQFIVSIDSLVSDTYALIRKNGNLDIVMQNIEYLLSIKRLQVLAVCPMIQNVYELPAILDWCGKRGIDCWLQIVEFPLGGYIHGIHQFPENNIPNFYESSNKHAYGGVNVNLDKKLPLVAFNTLSFTEKTKIKEFLEGSVYPARFQGQIQALIQQILS